MILTGEVTEVQWPPSGFGNSQISERNRDVSPVVARVFVTRARELAPLTFWLHTQCAIQAWPNVRI